MSQAASVTFSINTAWLWLLCIILQRPQIDAAKKRI
jgi:hypothetical protein